MSSFLSRAVLAMTISLLLGGVPPNTCRAEDATTLIKQANGSLREGQGHFFGGRLGEAETSVAAAEAAVAALRSADPGQAQLAALEQKCAKLRRDIDGRKAKATAPSAIRPGAAAAAPAAVGQKIPSGAQFRLKEANRSLEKAERVLAGPSAASYKAEASRAAIQEAQAALAEIEKMFGAQVPAGDPDMKAARDRMAAIEQQIVGVQTGAAAAQARQASSAADAAAWLSRFEPYILGVGQAGHQANKYLVASGTDDPQELVRRLALRGEAASLLEEYARAGVAAPSDELAEAMRQLRYAVDSFDGSLKSLVEGHLAEAERRAGEVEDFLKRQDAAPAGKALVLEKDQLAGLRKRIEAAAAVARPGEARVAALRTRLADCESRDAAARQARVEQTRMTADRYTAADLSTLRQKAGDLVREKLAGAKILRTTVISTDWKEESVIEATDTTHTALRHRTTRSVTAQVAARHGDRVQLHTLDLSKDLQAGGSWGPVYGHIMFTDPMLEKNVN